MKKLLITLPTALLISVAAQQSAANAADAVCVNASPFGVQCLTPKGWVTFSRKTGHLKSNFVRDLRSCGGKIYIAASRSIYTFDGEKMSAANRMPTGFAGSISCDSAGGYWIGASSKIAYWNGSAWKFFETKSITNDPKLKYVSSIAAGPKGTAWAVISSRAVAHYDGSAWKVYKEGQGFDKRLFLSKIAVGKDGKVYLPHSRGLATFEGGAWKTLAGPSSARSIKIGPKGTIWMSYFKRLTAFKKGAWKQINLTNRANDVAVDAKGRPWVASIFGLGVLNDGKWEWRQMHNSDLTSNNLRKIAVIGNGATLPALKEQAKGSLKARFEWRSGEALVGARVEICGTPPSFILRGRKSPCSGKPFATGSKTDKNGMVKFSGLKPGIYYISLRPEGARRWSLSYSVRRNRVLPGKDQNTGTWRVRKRK